MAINIYLQAQLEYLHKGFELDLILPTDLAEHFMYLNYIYEMMSINR